MKKLFLLLASCLMLTSCNSAIYNKKIIYDEIKYQDHYDTINSLKPSIDQAAIKYLTTNTEEYRQITHLYDGLLFGDYNITKDSINNIDYIRVHYSLIYKVPETPCWQARYFQVSTANSVSNNIVLDENKLFRMGDLETVVLELQQFNEDEDTKFNALFDLFEEDKDSYKNSYGFINKDKKDILNIYNVSKSSNVYYDLEIKSGDIKYKIGNLYNAFVTEFKAYKGD